MIMSHEHIKAACMDFESCSRFCDMKTVLFQKWGQFLPSVVEDTCHCSGYEFSCVYELSRLRVAHFHLTVEIDVTSGMLP